MVQKGGKMERYNGRSLWVKGLVLCAMIGFGIATSVKHIENKTK